MYLKALWCSTAVELQHQIYLAVLLLDLEDSLLPPGRAQIQADEANTDSSAAAQLGHCNSHYCC